VEEVIVRNYSHCYDETDRLSRRKERKYRERERERERGRNKLPLSKGHASSGLPFSFFFCVTLASSEVELLSFTDSTTP